MCGCVWWLVCVQSLQGTRSRALGPPGRVRLRRADELLVGLRESPLNFHQLSHQHTHTPRRQTFLPHPLHSIYTPRSHVPSVSHSLSHTNSQTSNICSYVYYFPRSRCITSHPPSSSCDPLHTYPVIHVSPMHVFITHSLAHINHYTNNISDRQNDHAHLLTATASPSHTTHIPPTQSHMLFYLHTLTLPSSTQANSYRHHSDHTHYRNLPC